MAAFFTTTIARTLLCGPSFSGVDVAVALATAAFWCVQEHWIHDRLLHSEAPWFGETVHRWHHELPYYHVSMDGLGLAVTWFGAVAVLLVGVGVALGGGTALPYCLTALGTYTLFGGIYEAAHYLAHTQVPLPRALADARSHHMKHHTIDDQYWLAFTLPVIDELFDTSPLARDVVRSRSESPSSAGRRRRRQRQESL